MTNPTLWNQLLIWPIINVLVAFYKLFEFLHIPGPMGFAIILLTIVIRIVLYPLMITQLRSAKKMASLKPHLDELTARHKDDKPALQQAQLALYKEHGVNPAAGCLPLLVQLPVLIALYNVFYQVLNNGNAEQLLANINQILYVPALKLAALDLTFFGLHLGTKPSQWQTGGWWLLSIPVITGLLQWYQTKLMLPPSQPKQALAKSGEKRPEDTAMEMQKQMALITPIMFGYFALQFPIGLALYWNVFGVFGIMQQLRVNREK
jgi:YidC/Oxa1 family membrane protein insertase